MTQKKTLHFLLENKSSIEIGPNDFLLFFDETGHEKLSDSNFPIFGFGACGFPCNYYLDTIHPAWEYMKHTFFSEYEGSLHACDQRLPTSSEAQFSALAHFWTKFDFIRLGLVATGKTANQSSHEIYEIIYKTLSIRLSRIMAWIPTPNKI